jgi:phage terminase small subunit
MNEQTALHGKLAGIPLGPKMQACNERERIFAFAYATGIASSAGEAALLAGYGAGPALTKSGRKSNSLNSRGHQLVHKPRVLEAIEEVCRTEFRNLVPLVIGAAKRLLLNAEHPDHQKTVISLLSRLGYGEKASVDVNVSGEVVVNHTDAAIEDLRRLKLLGVPREQLIETFGFSGLDRYEKLLAERQPKLIEATATEVLPTGAVEETT